MQKYVAEYSTLGFFFLSRGRELPGPYSRHAFPDFCLLRSETELRRTSCRTESIYQGRRASVYNASHTSHYGTSKRQTRGLLPRCPRSCMNVMISLQYCNSSSEYCTHAQSDLLCTHRRSHTVCVSIFRFSVRRWENVAEHRRLSTN
jgi:hypothetical protein